MTAWPLSVTWGRGEVRRGPGTPRHRRGPEGGGHSRGSPRPPPLLPRRPGEVLPLAEPRTHAGGTASHRLAESVLESLPQQAGWPAPELGGTGHAASPHGAAARGSLAATPQLPEPTARPGPDLPAPRVKRHAEHTEFLPSRRSSALRGEALAWERGHCLLRDPWVGGHWPPKGSWPGCSARPEPSGHSTPWG